MNKAAFAMVIKGNLPRQYPLRSRGVLSIRYRNVDQLDDIARRLESGTGGAPKASPGPRIRSL